MSGRYVGHIIRYDKCAICGNCWKTGKLLHPEKNCNFDNKMEYCC